jgi:hypothetical protein
MMMMMMMMMMFVLGLGRISLGCRSSGNITIEWDAVNDEDFDGTDSDDDGQDDDKESGAWHTIVICHVK